MAKKPRSRHVKKNKEQTSASVASVAGRLLSDPTFEEDRAWLFGLAMKDTTADTADRVHALRVLGKLDALKMLAGSALTQHGGSSGV